jgi:hypothetical protein
MKKVGKEIRSSSSLTTNIIKLPANTRFTARAAIRATILGAILLNIFMMPVNISFNSAQASLAAGTAEVWWPTNGAHVQGTQPFKAMVEGLDVEQYDMYWSVDGGQENKMDTNYQDYPHKETSVDLAGWTWKGQGPYEVTFVAKKGGVAVAKSSVKIYNDGAPAQTSTEVLNAPAPTGTQTTASPIEFVQSELKK